MAYIVGEYDKKARTIRRLGFLLLMTEDLREGYIPGGSVVVGKKEYILTNRRILSAGTVIQYDLVLKG